MSPNWKGITKREPKDQALKVKPCRVNQTKIYYLDRFVYRLSKRAHTFVIEAYRIL